MHSHEIFLTCNIRKHFWCTHFYNSLRTFTNIQNLNFYLKGPQWKQSYVNAFLVSSQPQVFLFLLGKYIYIYIYTHHILYIYIYIYIYIRSICRQQLFRSLRAHQYSSDQKKILKDQNAQTTA